MQKESLFGSLWQAVIECHDYTMLLMDDAVSPVNTASSRELGVPPCLGLACKINNSISLFDILMQGTTDLYYIWQQLPS